MTNVLVTGGSGFIGSALIKRLQRQTNNVIKLSSADGDISSLDLWREHKCNEVSHVFHLAGRTYVPDSWINPYEFYKTNVLGTESVLEFCRSQDIPLTYVSAYIYGVPTRLPISEDDPINPNNPYAHSKYLGEELCRFYASAYGLNIVIIRPFNAYGKGQAANFLIPSIIDQVLHNDEIVVRDLAPKRDYIYLSDLVEAVVATNSIKRGFHVYNIGSGHSYSVKEVIDIIQSCARTNKPVVCKGKVRTNEIQDVKADTSRARKNLGWECLIGFKEGIKEIINWELSK